MVFSTPDFLLASDFFALKKDQSNNHYLLKDALGTLLSDDLNKDCKQMDMADSCSWNAMSTVQSLHCVYFSLQLLQYLRTHFSSSHLDFAKNYSFFINVELFRDILLPCLGHPETKISANRVSFRSCAQSFIVSWSFIEYYQLLYNFTFS